MGVVEDRVLTRDPAVLPVDLVFVDLETTGGNAAYDRITEVGIVRMVSGVVVEEWSSLVNPECTIPSYIERFTGITNEMVADAPRFAEIAAVVREKLGSSIFVAHNARFDYAFLRTEFRRLDLCFSSRVLCTVKLSRRLFPEFVRHNLDTIMERHGLECAARHRALGDARVLSDFWAKLRSDIPQDRLAEATHAILGANRLPPHLPQGLADELPEGPGVYRFFDGNHALLYIGRSASLRTRVLGHFTAAHAGAKERNLAEEHSEAKEQKKALAVRHIDWVETAGILGAQLKEAQWIKAQQPLYNRRVKPGAGATLQMLPAQGVRCVSIDELELDALADCYGVFQSPKDARKALTDIARAHSLCLKILRLEEGEGSCLGAHSGKCKGACIGQESLLLHDMRLHLALSSLKFKSWPFPGRIALAEGQAADGRAADGRVAGPAEYHVLDRWSYLGTARSEDELAELAGARSRAAFDVDTYRILVRHFAKYPDLRWQDLRSPYPRREPGGP